MAAMAADVKNWRRSMFFIMSGERACRESEQAFSNPEMSLKSVFDSSAA
jgi:hypothetical protein